MSNIGTYAKAVVLAVAAAASAFVTATQDGDLSNQDRITVALAFVVGLGALALIPNTPKWLANYGPVVVGFLVALGGQMFTALDDGTIVGQEWLAIFIALFGASGLVWLVPNAGKSDALPPDAPTP